MGRWIAAVALAGCYAPQIHAGGSCSADQPCPSELRCVASTCVEPGAAEPADAAGSDARALDAPGSADAALSAIRIDVDGPAYTGIDYPGSWAADPGTGGICDGSPYASPTQTVNGTNDSTLFVGQMFGAALHCTIPDVPPGAYRVTLLFAELRLGQPPCETTTPPARIFDIALEGTTVATAFDMTDTGGGCAARGGPGHAFAESYMVAITDGELDVVETASQGAATLNAIELEPQ